MEFLQVDIGHIMQERCGGPLRDFIFSQNQIENSSKQQQQPQYTTILFGSSKKKDPSTKNLPKAKTT